MKEVYIDIRWETFQILDILRSKLNLDLDETIQFLCQQYKNKEI